MYTQYIYLWKISYSLGGVASQCQDSLPAVMSDCISGKTSPGLCICELGLIVPSWQEHTGLPALVMLAGKREAVWASS